MAKLARDKDTTTLHPRENLVVAGNLGSLNSEIIVKNDGASSVSLDLRGTFNLTLEVAGTIDGVNWFPIPMRPVNVAAVKYVAVITGSAAGGWVGKCGPYLLVRVRCTAYTSGSAVATVLVSNALLDDTLNGMITTDIATNTGAAAAAVTLTLAAPGAGLRHYLTYLAISRFATAALTAAAAPVLVTTTNIPTGFVLNFPADAALQGSIDRYREDFTYPLATAAQNTATTFVCPATPNVIWRATAGFYLAQ
jgi:hypothetical protein